MADETEMALYAEFRQTANLLSRFYSQCITGQTLAFQAGQTYAIMEIHEWMLGKLQEGRMITVADILGYLQDKMDSLDEVDATGSGQNIGCLPAGMGASSFAPPDQGTAAPPQDQDIVEMAAQLFGPDDQAGVSSSVQEMHVDGM